MMRVSMKELVVLLLISLSSFTRATCPSKKASRKSQRTRLETLQADDVVVEAMYLGQIDTTHRFAVEQTWQKNNGGLNRDDAITVQVSDSSLDGCFTRLRPKDNYILMMKEVEAEDKVFRPTEAPVSSQRKRHRQEIWMRLCKTLDNDPSTCEMRITLPSKTIFYRGSMKMLQCKVESSSEIVEVMWFKDEQDLDTAMHKKAGIFIDKSDIENSFLMFRAMSHVHNGEYRCEARNEDGQIAEAVAKVTVIGPKLNSHFTTCKDHSYCLNRGTCLQFIDEETQPICECQPGYDGDRCQNTADDITASSAKDEENLLLMKENVSQLTTAVAIVSLALAIVLFVSSMYIIRLRRRLSPHKDEYDAVELSNSGSDHLNHDVHIKPYSSHGTEAASVRLSDIDRLCATDSRRSRQNSSRSIEISPSPRPHYVMHEQSPTTGKIINEIEVNASPTKSEGQHASTGSERFSSRRGRLSARS